MRPAGIALFLWGVLMGALALVAVLFFNLDEPETPALLGGAAGLAALTGALIAVTGAVRAESGPRVLPDISPATVWLAASLSLLALSAQLGLWLTYIAGGMVLVGIGGLVRELRAQRETARTAAERER
jgi:hypothetical protein